jgi:hypothetical protein
MKILALTDLHGNMHALRLMEHLAREADLVILAGDITHFGREKEMQQVIGQLLPMNVNIFAVSGNCDHPGAEQYLSDAGIALNLMCRPHGGIYFAGLSGSLPCPGRTPQEYSEEEFLQKLDALSTEIKKPFLFISHQPPFHTLNDRVTSGHHVGSRAIRRFIEMH